MARRIQLYVSATRDLDIEREAVGQTVAELPVALGWQVDVTPDAGVPLDPDAVRCADFYICMIGVDATAPVGVEWAWAQRAGVSTLAYRKRVNYSPSAQSFLRDTAAMWTPFDDARDLQKRLKSDLAQRLLDRALALGLELNELGALQEFLSEEAERPVGPVAEDRRRGAGKSGVIFGREGPEDLSEPSATSWYGPAGG